MWGLGKGCGPNEPWVLSAAVTPRGSRRGRPRPFALKWGTPGCLIQKRRGCGGTAGSHRPRRPQTTAAVHLHPAGARVPSFLPALVYHPVTTPPLFIFTAPSRTPPRPHDPFIHTPRPSPPHHGPPATAPALGLLRGSHSPRPSPVPTLPRTDWRGGARGLPASAAQPRPFTHGRGVALTQPPALDVLLVSP